MCSGLENYAHLQSADRQNKWFSSRNMCKINEIRTSHFATAYETNGIRTSHPKKHLFRRSAEMRCAQDSRTTHICNPRIDRISGFQHLAVSPLNNPSYCRSAEMRCAQDSSEEHIQNPRIDEIRVFFKAKLKNAY